MNLIKAIVISPGELFKNSKEKKRDIVLLFVISFAVVFLKSFFKGRYATNFNFFENQSLNEVFSFLAIPQVTVVTTYISFFIFVSLLFLIVKIFSKEASFKTLLFSLMSISGIGVIAHLIATPMMFFAESFIMSIGYVFYLWVVVLSVLAIKNSQSLPLVKAVTSFLIVALPFLLFGWLPVISPYLIYLAV
ncbi:hypothetical protein G3N55_12195 [Dissulfurirhabdus thermomarina]|uniref:Yip1 domain-containing protein n=1 Tax=Dissulfurirhabdus thermomarina TaxID=1765737 RepID=A0A6N9TQR3_DISTH|nr:YIP1 family protein [Dissulfurirhabdus thermomarina]NDY43595.1 hypothetical protein [Dissulfurirhabdus thermomarina]NMX24554.1 hypothetical protein [Dissulfurirhabdus thermomarina]